MTIPLSTLYTILDIQQVDEQYRYKLQLHPDHSIYKGHFPQQPILPGVCFLQIVTELTSQATGAILRLTQLRAAKFPSPLNPNQHPILVLKLCPKPLVPQQWTVEATATADKVTFL